MSITDMQTVLLKRIMYKNLNFPFRGAMTYDIRFSKYLVPPKLALCHYIPKKSMFYKLSCVSFSSTSRSSSTSDTSTSFQFGVDNVSTLQKSNKVNDVSINDNHSEIRGLYYTPVEHHGDPRGHLWPDGTRKWEYSSESFHWDEYWANVPQQEFVMVNGQKMIKGIETRPMEELYCTSQKNLPFWSRNRLNIWGNYSLILKAEFLFFWIPTAIIWSLAIPCFTMIYMMDEAIYTTMTVKVIGRQWYWVYEVESPPEDEDE